MMKIFKMMFVLVPLFLITFSVSASAININMNSLAGDTNTISDGSTTGDGEVENIQDSIQNSGSSDISGTTAPSGVSSIAQENMSFSNILNILIITIGVILILFAIAILIRLKN